MLGLMQDYPLLVHTTLDFGAASQLSAKRYEVGEIELLNLLQVQTRWSGSQISHINIQNQQLVQRIILHLVLGGSFEEVSQP